MENNATDDQKRAPKDKSMSRFFTICFQGLHSNDQRILSSVLDRADPDLIDNTVSPSISLMTFWRCPAFVRIELVTGLTCLSDIVIRYDVSQLRPLCLWFKLWWGSSRYNKNWFWITDWLMISMIISTNDGDVIWYLQGRGRVDASHAKWLRSVLGLHTGYLVQKLCYHKELFQLSSSFSLSLSSNRCRYLNAKIYWALFLLFWKREHSITVR